jgi:hypothetical protein
MTVEELLHATKGKLLTPHTDLTRTVACGYACDLLSWVMARGKPGTAWVTVQTHLNVIAVASLLEMSAVVIPDSIEAEEASVVKANDEGIAVISSPLSAFELCAQMANAGLRSA